jgi:hypothetical protein
VVLDAVAGTLLSSIVHLIGSLVVCVCHHRHVTAELHPNPHLPPAFMTAALMGQQLQCASLAPNADDIFGKGFVSEAPLHLGEDARASQAEAEAMAAAAAAQAAANPGPPMHTAEWYAAFSNAVAAILPPKRRDATRQRHCWLQVKPHFTST